MDGRDQGECVVTLEDARELRHEALYRFLLRGKEVPMIGLTNPNPDPNYVYTTHYDPKTQSTTVTWKKRGA